MYRVVFEGHILICIGLLAKTWSDDMKDRGQDGWTTSFFECAYAISVGESETAYCRIMTALAQAFEICLEVPDFLDRVGQWHSDRNLGAEAMRRQLLAHAVRAMDWAHFVGCVRPKVHYAQANCFCACATRKIRYVEMRIRDIFFLLRHVLLAVIVSFIWSSLPVSNSLAELSQL